ncbi:hypothetical protein R1sor_017704 [Riccia sorocarpa]|uniref:Endonuclease/exonuclease/phosphatase domain-containing protein n=1 Tax=Riccia sorocarpa TaxID=122646 RepID=A0ABD3IAE1_9MARC
MLSKEEDLTRAHRRVMPRSSAIVDYKENGDGDAVLLCHESLRIVERGVSGKGFAAWARIQTSVGVVRVISLHAPNDSRKRKEVWIWMRDLVADERWIVLGDFNMVESQEDSIGPSPVLKQDEKRSWDLCAGRTDMVDARLCATRCLGPHFTRQAWHGDRFDQSRLDRFYLSKRGEWVYHIRSVEHQGARALSDHVPIKMEVMLKEAEASTRPRRSYFKTEYKMLMKPEVLARAKGVWIDHPRWAKDKRKRWTLVLGRIRKLLMDIRDEERRREEATGGTEERLEAARKRVQHDQSEEAKQLFEEAVTAQRRREHEEAERCRRRCKITWLKEGRSFKYLGVATSSPVDEKTITEEIVQKLMKKLKHWNFLWGWNEDRNPLVAWERIAQEKLNGGIGWTSFRTMSDALNVRLIGRILEGGSAEWIQLARQGPATAGRRSRNWKSANRTRAGSTQKDGDENSSRCNGAQP